MVADNTSTNKSTVLVVLHGGKPKGSMTQTTFTDKDDTDALSLINVLGRWGQFRQATWP